MRLAQWTLIVVTAASAFGPAVSLARAQATAVPDATGRSAPDSAFTPAPVFVFSPTYTNRINGDVSSVGMFNELRATTRLPWRAGFNFSLTKERKEYRLQNRFEDNKRLQVSLIPRLGPDVKTTVSYGDSRVFNRSIAVGGGVQDFIINDRSVSGNVGYVRRFGELRMDGLVKGSAVNGERTFKTDQTLAGGFFGGVAYQSQGGRFSLEGRGGLGDSDQRSTTRDTTYTGLGASEDSLVARAHFAINDSISFNADYVDYHGDREFTDQARGSLGGQLEGAENVFKEIEFHDVRSTMLTMTSRLPMNFSLGLSANHDEDAFDYLVQKERFSNTVTDGFHGDITYKMPWKTAATVTFEGSSTLRDLGPQSVSSLTDKRKLVRLALSHKFTQTLVFDLNGSTQLLQSFYLDYEANPRDRDQVDSSVNLRISSQPFKPILANISIAFSGSEFINIDASESGNNRTRELYELRPGFTYTMNEWLSIIQLYGLTIEYTDFTYKPDDNFLDRNISFSNTFAFKPMTHTDFKFEYALYLHDTGSYLPDPVTGEDVLNVQSEDRRDRTTIRVDYRVNPHIGVFGEHLYSRFETHSLVTDSRSTTTDGQIKVGSRGNYDWGKGRTLTFSLARVKRFSPYGAELDKNFWEAQSEFLYPF